MVVNKTKQKLKKNNIYCTDGVKNNSPHIENNVHFGQYTTRNGDGRIGSI